MNEMSAGKWGVWRMRFQLRRERLAAECAPEGAGEDDLPVWLEPEAVNVLGDADGYAVVERVRRHLLERILEDETAEPLEDGSFTVCRFTEFRLLGIRPVAVINLK